ncbi:MAG: DUF3025 domain-containing protein [Burkholderiaceae bacterium]|nr:DUF3025 domain-containing protein [Burkholderiaceae bacterium]
MAHGLETIDWSAPWLAHLRSLGEDVATQGADHPPLCDRLNRLPTAPVTFVPQSFLPAGMAYESYIFNSKQCPTRAGLHDFFNALCWIRFPLIKTRLNHLQTGQIELLGSVTTRGPVRDALTVFDENAAFLIAPPVLWEALLAKDWKRLFVTLRPLWAQAQLVLFGHALLEKLVNPRKPITAHVYISKNAIEFTAHQRPKSLAELDAWIAADLSADTLAAKPFAPLPVLGVPGWWADNDEPSFYADDKVFRPPA